MKKNQPTRPDGTEKILIIQSRRIDSLRERGGINPKNAAQEGGWELSHKVLITKRSGPAHISCKIEGKKFVSFMKGGGA